MLGDAEQKGESYTQFVESDPDRAAAYGDEHAELMALLPVYRASNRNIRELRNAIDDLNKIPDAQVSRAEKLRLKKAFLDQIVEIARITNELVGGAPALEPEISSIEQDLLPPPGATSGANRSAIEPISSADFIEQGLLPPPGSR